MKRIIRLTESDLVRIVKRVMNEGVKITMPGRPWKAIENVVQGNAMGLDNNTGDLVLYKEPGNPNAANYEQYYDFSIIQNPRQVQLDQAGKMEVVSFDPTRKLVKFTNGVVIGPDPSR